MEGTVHPFLNILSAPVVPAVVVPTSSSPRGGRDGNDALRAMPVGCRFLGRFGSTSVPFVTERLPEVRFFSLVTY